MKLFIAILFSAIVSQGLLAQEDSSTRHPKNLIYGEAGGNAFMYSLNYARIFELGGLYATARLGFGCVPFEPGASYLVPGEVSLLIGHRRNYFELGGGMTLDSEMMHNSEGPNNQYTRATGVNLVGRLGYAFIPVNRNRPMFRIAITPILFSDKVNQVLLNPLPWAGASIGWAF